MSDNSYLETLASCTQTEKMDYSTDNWKPSDGLYTVLITEVKGDSKDEGGVRSAWQRPSFQIVGGEFEGRSFSDYFYFDLADGALTMHKRRHFLLSTCLAGREIFDTLEAATIIDQAAGQAIQLEIKTNLSKKNGKSYQNIYYKQTVGTEDAAV